MTVCVGVLHNTLDLIVENILHLFKRALIPASSTWPPSKPLVGDYSPPTSSPSAVWWLKLQAYYVDDKVPIANGSS